MSRHYDIVGVGIGPFNLGLAALADATALSACFLERRDAFAWHPGLLLEGARLQVPFLADLVSLVDPTSRWSFLAYLRERDRLFPFYFSERFHVPRIEYDDYCRYVAESLPSCRFGVDVSDIDWDDAAGVFRIAVTGAGGGPPEEILAANVVVGIGTAPYVPPPLRPLLGERGFHAADYLDRSRQLIGADDVTVVGSGQSGAEVFLDLLRRRPGKGRLRWLTASPAFAPMEYSKLGLEHFTPAYSRYFQGLEETTREELLPAQWQLYKAISADTIAEIYEALYERTLRGDGHDGVEIRPCVDVCAAEVDASGIRLTCRQTQQDRRFAVETDGVVLATGYSPREATCLRSLDAQIERDSAGRPKVAPDYALRLSPHITGRIFVQNAETHTHGIGTPDLGLGAYRSATILNAIAGREVHRLPERTSFTSFGCPA